MTTNKDDIAKERALAARINRRLANEGQRLTVSRSPKALARYIIVDTHQGKPVAWADTLEEWARGTGVET